MTYSMQQEVYELVWRLPDDKFYALADRLGVTAVDVKMEIEGWSEGDVQACPGGRTTVVQERVARANIMADRLRSKDEADMDSVMHEPDFSTVMHADGVCSSEGIIDVNCRKCGRSGSTRIESRDIDWGSEVGDEFCKGDG